MRLEHTLTYRKNKPSGTGNALVSAENMTSTRVYLGSELEELRSTPILFLYGAKAAKHRIFCRENGVGLLE
jgi:hypothetical protein